MCIIYWAKSSFKSLTCDVALDDCRGFNDRSTNRMIKERRRWKIPRRYCLERFLFSVVVNLRHLILRQKSDRFSRKREGEWVRKERRAWCPCVRQTVWLSIGLAALNKVSKFSIARYIIHVSMSSSGIWDYFRSAAAARPLDRSTTCNRPKLEIKSSWQYSLLKLNHLCYFSIFIKLTDSLSLLPLSDFIFSALVCSRSAHET